MPIFEYKAIPGSQSCAQCRAGVEVIQTAHEDPIRTCPQCGAAVTRVFAPPHVRVKGSEGIPVERRIREHEREGRFSHAAELADKEAEKTSREDLKTRALENYKKAGYKDL